MKKVLGWILILAVPIGVFAFAGYQTGYLNALIAFGKTALVMGALASLFIGAILISE